MSKTYSPSSNTFYADDFHDEYVAAGTWPADGVSVTDDAWHLYTQAPPAGYALGPVNGAPAWVAAPVVVPAPVTRMSPLVFIARFNATEQAAIATAAQTNASIMLWLIRCAGATYVDVADAETVSGVSALSSAGLIAAARVPTILAPL